ncbi:thioredoxin family protein [Saprospiraceae bacterium]|mgnify:FL=1|nr:thioredoxin family protein [Saprospiraceae bacterium]
MKEELGDQVHIIKIDIDENEEVSKQLNIRSIPTLIIYDKEEMQWRQTGSESKQTLVRKLEKYLD